MIDVNIFGIPWEEIVNWFVIQPIYGQILILVGVIALLALAIVLVYYILKGVAYLVYYILKGTYYLLKGIGLLFYKACEALYYAISEKPKPGSVSIQQPGAPQIEIQPEPIIPIQKNHQHIQPDATFCTECGTKYTDKMIQTLSNKGSVFCIHCGKGFQANFLEIEI
ncbi:hypothetical protein LCGC14_1724400 [marine sediment metagenome]|uniref:Uncharacterized protein n=1 Tax=marine sediment metagenome TaxID=412755 RepID=A0A0F9KB62_9ZZZZ